MENNCIKEEVINDLKDRVSKLENNDREDFGTIKELKISIDMFRESSERQAKVISDVSDTLLKVSSSLDTLTKDNRQIKQDVTELKNDVYKKFDELENQIDDNEDKNKIDIREIQKSKFTDKLKTYGIPFAAIAGLITGLVEILKSLKIIK
jgi:gas vesicle protein